MTLRLVILKLSSFYYVKSTVNMTDYIARLLIKLKNLPKNTKYSHDSKLHTSKIISYLYTNTFTE